VCMIYEDEKCRHMQSPAAKVATHIEVIKLITQPLRKAVRCVCVCVVDKKAVEQIPLRLTNSALPKDSNIETYKPILSTEKSCKHGSTEDQKHADATKRAHLRV
jgi:hypothetical protein